MTWIYLNDIDLTQGETLVAVNDPTNLEWVIEGWALIHDDKFYEIKDGTAPINGVCQLHLENPWPLSSATGQAAIILPVNAPLEELIRRFKQEVAQLYEWRQTFDLLTWREGYDFLRVTEDGTKIEPISARSLLTGAFGAAAGDINSLAEFWAIDIVESLLVEKTAGAPLAQYRAAALNPSGDVVLADPSSDSLSRVIGLTYNSADAGGTVKIKTSGKVVMPSASWTANERLFLAADGLMTHTAPSSGFIVSMGIATSSTEMILNVDLGSRLKHLAGY